LAIGLKNNESFLFLGPAKHCTNYTLEEQNRPTSFNQVFQLRNSPLENCGDLLFSGHMVSASCVVYCITYYLFVMISTNKRKFVRFSVIAYVIFIWICLACQIFTAIATRNHYTVDIWLGGLIGKNRFWKKKLYTYILKKKWHFWYSFDFRLHELDVAPFCGNTKRPSCWKIRSVSWSENILKYRHLK
jgi:hypothetical protein